MRKSTGVLDPDVGNAPVANFDSILSWSAEVGLPEVESLIRAIERANQDVGDGELATKLVEKLRSWRILADAAQRDREIVRALETLLLRVLVIVSLRISYSKSGVIRELARLEPISEPTEQDVSPMDARKLLLEAAARFQHHSALIHHIRELVETGASGIHIIEEIRQAFPSDENSVPSTYDGFDFERAAIVRNSSHQWTLSVKFDRQPMPVATAGGILWAIGEAVESVDGVAAQLEDLRAGSVWADIRLYIRSIWRLDDVVEILERAFDKVGGRSSTRQIEESNASQDREAKIESLNIAARQLQEQQEELARRGLDRQSSSQKEADSPDEFERVRRQLDIQTGAYELERKRLEIRMLKLDYYERVSDLLAKQLLEVDTVEFIIENYPIFIMHEGKIIERNPIRPLRDRELDKSKATGSDGTDLPLP